MQNKCVRYCLNLGNRAHIGFSEFKQINWLNTSDRFLQCICATSFNFFKGKCPEYMREVFDTAHQSNISTRFSYLKLNLPKRKTNMGQKTLSYLGPQQWNKLPNELKKCVSLNTFKHKIKTHFFENLERRKTLGLI